MAVGIGPLKRIVDVNWSNKSLIIEYQWFATSGTDLATRTRLLLNGANSGTGIGDGNITSAAIYDANGDEVVALRWYAGPENSSGGYEIIRVYVDDIILSTGASVALECNAHWFGAKADGQIVLKAGWATTDDPTERVTNPAVIVNATITNLFNNAQRIGNVVVAGSVISFTL